MSIFLKKRTFSNFDTKSKESALAQSRQGKTEHRQKWNPILIYFYRPNRMEKPSHHWSIQFGIRFTTTEPRHNQNIKIAQRCHDTNPYQQKIDRLYITESKQKPKHEPQESRAAKRPKCHQRPDWEPNQNISDTDEGTNSLFSVPNSTINIPRQDELKQLESTRLLDTHKTYAIEITLSEVKQTIANIVEVRGSPTSNYSAAPSDITRPAIGDISPILLLENETNGKFPWQ